MDGVIKGTTSRGFSFEIPIERFQNYLTLKLLKAADKDNTKILDVVPRILGEDGERKMIEILGGDPSFNDVILEIKEIFDIVKADSEAKKSSSLPN